ncbi:MAG: hypothetical protein AB2392_05010 [Neobacillus sp.]
MKDENNVNELLKAQQVGMNNLTDLFKDQSSIMNAINELVKDQKNGLDIKELLNVQTPGLENISTGNLMSLANEKLSEGAIDLGSIMNVASTLLKNESVMNSLQGVGKGNGSAAKNGSKASVDLSEIKEVNEQFLDQMKSEMTLMKELIEKEHSQIITALESIRDSIQKLSIDIMALKLELLDTNRAVLGFAEQLSSKKKKDKN